MKESISKFKRINLLLYCSRPKVAQRSLFFICKRRVQLFLENADTNENLIALLNKRISTAGITLTSVSTNPDDTTDSSTIEVKDDMDLYCTFETNNDDPDPDQAASDSDYQSKNTKNV